MAKSAKEAPEVEFTPQQVNKIIKNVFDELAELETQRGKFMKRARDIRDKIASSIESGTQHGIPQKIMKLMVKIEEGERKQKKLIAELEAEERALLKRVVKAHGVPSQLSLFGPDEKKPRAAKATKPRGSNVVDLKQGDAASPAA